MYECKLKKKHICLKLHFTVCTRFVVNKHTYSLQVVAIVAVVVVAVAVVVGLTVICNLSQRFVHTSGISLCKQR